MSRESSTRRRVLQLGAIGLATGLAGCGSGSSSADGSPTQADGPTPGQQDESDPDATADASEYTEVYRNTISSVALVRTDQGQGTGFVHDDTHVVTNAHVVGSADSTRLRFSDGTWSDGSVRGADPHSDLAVVEAASVPDPAEPLPLDQEAAVIGQEVAAIGNPYNLDGSLTSGIVSGTDRLIPSPAGYRIPDAIQTDAAVNPGNSGGPLMSLEGDVVGVVNSKRGDNIAFGISAALARRVVPSLVESGDYEHAYLGAAFENVSPTVAEANGLSEPRGLLVVQTVDGGPAEGQLQPSEVELVEGQRVPVGGDVVLEIDGTAMESFEDLASYLALQTRPGDTIDLRVRRDGSEQTVEVTLGSRPEGSQSPLQ